jgi:Protein of unknown function (DUF732)
MTTSNPDDQPATTAGACDDETVIVPPTTQAAEQLAWSSENPATELLVGRSWRSVWTHAALLVLCGVLLSAAVVMVLRDQRGRPVTEPAPPRASVSMDTPTITSSMSVVAPAAPTTTVTVTAKAAPSAAPAEPDPDTTDQAFLAALRRVQINVSDPSSSVFGAHWVCGELRDGHSRADVVSAVKGRNPLLTDLGASDFVSDSVAFYCPQYA